MFVSMDLDLCFIYLAKASTSVQSTPQNLQMKDITNEP